MEGETLYTSETGACGGLGEGGVLRLQLLYTKGAEHMVQRQGGGLEAKCNFLWNTHFCFLSNAQWERCQLGHLPLQIVRLQN